MGNQNELIDVIDEKDRVLESVTRREIYEKKLRHLLEELFSRVESRPFKPGFLYLRFPHPFLLHKLFYFCQA